MNIRPSPEPGSFDQRLAELCMEHGNSFESLGNPAYKGVTREWGRDNPAYKLSFPEKLIGLVG